MKKLTEMNTSDTQLITATLIAKATKLGADLVGFADIEELKRSASFTFAPKMPGAGEGAGTRENETGLKPGEVLWPKNAKTVMVIAVHHPKDKPEMDWWFGLVDPPGNRVLAKVIRGLCTWIEEEFDFNAVHLAYHIEKGGTYLKDTAALAGLGCIGKNNMLVTPKYGPRVRLRALTLDIKLPSTGPLSFDPCLQCDDLCRKACPQKAYSSNQYNVEVYGQDILPGRDGFYARPACNQQMDFNVKKAKEQTAEGFDKPVKIIKYCRICEFTCPVGKPLK